MPAEEALRGAGKTALGAAMVRAAESGRADRLFDDPYAQAFLDAAPGAFPRRPGAGEQPAGAGPIQAAGAAFYARAAVRTRFFDDYLSAAVAAGRRQVVLLAAGLDARAFRLAWPPGTRVFEVDVPGVLAFKDEVLAGCSAVPRCERVTVPADLRRDWAERLAEAGFGQTGPTAWLAEGVLLYLTAGEAGRLLSRVTALSAAGSRLGFEHSPAGARRTRRPGRPAARAAGVRPAVEGRARRRRARLAGRPRMAARVPRARGGRRLVPAGDRGPGPRRLPDRHARHARPLPGRAYSSAGLPGGRPGHPGLTPRTILG